MHVQPSDCDLQMHSSGSTDWKETPTGVTQEEKFFKAINNIVSDQCRAISFSHCCWWQGRLDKEHCTRYRSRPHIDSGTERKLKQFVDSSTRAFPIHLLERVNKIATSMTSLEEKLNKCKVTVIINPCHYQYHLLQWVTDCGLRIALVSDDHWWPQSVIPFHRETKYPRDDNARSSWTDDKMWACPGYALMMSRIEFAAISPRAASVVKDEAFRIADYFHLIDETTLGFMMVMRKKSNMPTIIFKYRNARTSLVSADEETNGQVE